MQDAEAELVQPAMAADPTPQLGAFARLIEAMGGWPTMAGMATAGIVGVWIGFSQPAGLDLVAQQLLGGENTEYLVDLVPAFDSGFEEG